MLTRQDFEPLEDVVVSGPSRSHVHLWVKRKGALESIWEQLRSQNCTWTQRRDQRGVLVPTWDAELPWIKLLHAPHVPKDAINNLTIEGVWNWPELRRGTPGMAEFILTHIWMPKNPGYWSGARLMKGHTHLRQSRFKGHAVDALIRHFTDISEEAWRTFWEQRFAGDDNPLYERGIRHGEVFTRELYKLCGNPLPGQTYSADEAEPLFLAKFAGQPVTESRLNEAADLLEPEASALFVSMAKTRFGLPLSEEEAAAGKEALSNIPSNERASLVRSLDVFTPAQPRA